MRTFEQLSTNSMLGGMSFYSPRLGLACDAVLNFDVKLSKSDFVT